MPDIYKIGMTDRSPRQRCAELSSSTSVPTDFELVCVGEVFDAMGVEKRLHEAYRHARVNEGREFFELDEYSVLALVAAIQAKAEQSGGMFCFVKQSEIEAKLFELEQRQIEAARKRTAEFAVAHFLSQDIDPMYWPNPDGFNGFGDADELPF